MINFVAPILAKVVADKFLGGEGSRVQPISQYNAILRKQLGLLTSKT
jgi:hypothetical protein